MSGRGNADPTMAMGSVSARVPATAATLAPCGQLRALTLLLFGLRSQCGYILPEVETDQHATPPGLRFCWDPVVWDSDTNAWQFPEPFSSVLKDPNLEEEYGYRCPAGAGWVRWPLLAVAAELGLERWVALLGKEPYHHTHTHTHMRARTSAVLSPPRLLVLREMCIW